MSERQPERSEFTLHAETLQGDLMRMALDEIKALPQPWARLSEDKQEEVIMRLGAQVQEAVQQTIRILAGRGFTSVRATLDQVRYKNELRIQLSANRLDENRHKLTDAVGSVVVVVIADAEEFMGGKEDIRPEKTQRGLDI